MQLGVIGLSTMGANLARNAVRNGATVAIYNRTPERADEFLTNDYVQLYQHALNCFQDLILHQ